MLQKIERITTDKGIKGIELYFTGKPSAAIIERLKAAFFRWHSVKKCWYAKASDRTEKLAQELNDGDIMTEPVTAITSARTNAVKLAPLWDRCDVSTIPEHNRHADTKTICAECRAHLKSRFPEMKFSIRKTGHNSIDADIIAGPYTRELVYVDRFGNPDKWGRWENSAELDAVLNYCEAFLQSYNYDNCDYMTDYFDVNFYGSFGVSGRYETTEQTPEVKADCEAFQKAKAAHEIEQEALKAAAWEAYEKRMQEEREEAEKAEAIRAAQAAEIEEHVFVVDLPEAEQIAVFGLVQDCGKAASLKEVEERDNESIRTNSRAYRDIIISRKIEFSDERIFSNFCNLFLHDFSFLNGFGGWALEDCRLKNEQDFMRLNRKQRETVKTFDLNGVAVYLNGVFQFAIDPEGYSYARYILFPVGIFDEEQETQSATEYIAEHRKETQDLPPFYFPETIEKQAETADLQPGEDFTMLSVNEWLCMAQTTRGRLVELKPQKYAQYDDAAKISFIPEGKRNVSTDYIHAGQAVVVYRGKLPSLPEKILYTDVSDNMRKVNFAGSEANEFIIKAIEYYKAIGYNPVIDLIQR